MTTSIRLIWNHLVFVCGASALIAVVSGANVGRVLNENSTLKSPWGNILQKSPLPVQKCYRSGVLQEALGFQEEVQPCGKEVLERNESCSMPLCRKLSSQQ